MARIDLARRAQIGRERRERTRHALLTAAKRLFSDRTMEAVSVDDIVAAAGVAKGTFYYHFRDFEALMTAIGEELALGFDELVQPRRSMLHDPLERFTWGQYAFLSRAEAQPRWGRLVRHARFTQDSAAASVRDHVWADLEAARRAGKLTQLDTSFAARLVLVMGQQFIGEIGDTSQPHPPVEAMLRTILRALGIADAEAAAIVKRVADGAGIAPVVDSVENSA